MKTSAALLFAAALSLVSAQEAPTSGAREALRARIAEDARKADAQRKKTAPAAKSAAAPASTAPAAKAAPANSAPAPASAPTSSASSSGKAASPTSSPISAATPPSAAAVLPQVEVRQDRITVTDVKIAEQERALAREAKNVRPSELDTALNDAKIARPLAIFGGDSSQFRSGVASERVALMEAEKDLLEAIGQARTKEEKAALQKQLDELKAMRRQLERTMR
jgi:hypothetical protein